MRSAALIGTGSYLPDNVLTNFDLEKMVDTSNEWIMKRTGISERRIADKEMATSDLSIHAARRAIKSAKIDPLEIDMIIVSTSTPDSAFPSTACSVQNGIGAKNSYGFDLAAACSGFVYGLDLADGMIKSSRYDTVLVVGAEIFSRIIDWEDKSTCVLFGDAAGAAIIQVSEEPGIIASYCGADGAYADADLLGVPAGGSRMPASAATVDQKLHTVKMRGQEVFKLGVRIMPEAAQKVLDTAGVSIDQVDLVIPHQANSRIIEAVGDRIGIDPEKIYVNVNQYGNTSAASVIVALDEAIREEHAKVGDLILLTVFGAGLTWGSTLIRL
ncbi:TPA: ketoacyl-ACP synthase III [Candidatus Poribacteria bacterium]|nr:ketoacyl-ACP synthase III [Candidatus Poribacteria bacterium]HIB91112.1 ketoacyl-ACP synthase III [Candidatus Poribacteria bacterium]HIB98180.1 ketoacyl-ACP synthase III [Candidatus Poribacteria bacterium]HIO49326.1 ketoacyl-ACP synthase III [Candidatus Poribacteria bacterium]HIO82180.1 ketoacyl-ACP synthase III [Candidatus Poribacteria bacterium]